MHPAGEVSPTPGDDDSWATAQQAFTALTQSDLAAAAAEKDRQLRQFKAGLCCWPGCRQARIETRDLPLAICEGHALIVYDALRQGQAEARAFCEHTVDLRPPRQRNAPGGWIYYAQADSRIKIGHSIDVHARMRSYPPDTRLLAVHPGTLADERDLHARFITWRVAGREWYEPSRMILEHIDRVIAEHGKPKPFAATPRRAPAVLKRD
jgi:hypothetical protein